MKSPVRFSILRIHMAFQSHNKFRDAGFIVVFVAVFIDSDVNPLPFVHRNLIFRFDCTEISIESSAVLHMFPRCFHHQLLQKLAGEESGSLYRNSSTWRLVPLDMTTQEVVLSPDVQGILISSPRTSSWQKVWTSRTGQISVLPVMHSSSSDCGSSRDNVYSLHDPVRSPKPPFKSGVVLHRITTETSQWNPADSQILRSCSLFWIQSESLQMMTPAVPSNFTCPRLLLYQGTNFLRILMVRKLIIHFWNGFVHSNGCLPRHLFR